MEIQENTQYRIYTVQEFNQCLAKLRDSGLTFHRFLGVQPIESKLIANVETFLRQTREPATHDKHRHQQDEHIVIGQHDYYKDRFVIIDDISLRYYQSLLIEQRVTVVDYVLDSSNALNEFR